MNEKELSSIENQLKKTGFAEAFTRELTDKIKDGVTYITHTFTKTYEGDEASAMLHIKKSDLSNLYFLNKYELSVRKDGQSNEVKQSFYINFRKNGERDPSKFYTTFTLKEAFNYLSGRPVLKIFENQNSEKYQAWVKANFKNTLQNGSYEMKQYHENYKFDLEKALANYSIKELIDPIYKKRLLESLQRGNLQSVTFVGADGKQEKLFISPNIPLGSLNVYNNNKERIPTQDLVEKQYIGKDFGYQLTQRITDSIQKTEQSQKQQHTLENESKEKPIENKEEKEGEKVSKENKHKQSNKQKQTDDKEKPKQRQRQKIH